MNWRLQGAGLATATILTSLPGFFGPSYTGNPIAFVSSWNTVVSAIQYLVLGGLSLILLGIVWRGPIGRASAWIQMFISFGLSCWMLFVVIGLGFTQAGLDSDCCRQLIPAVAPAQNLVAISLLIPTLSFASSLAWLFWDGRRRLQTSVEVPLNEIRRRQFEDTGQSLVSAVVTPFMLLFGVWLFFESSFTVFRLIASGVIVLSVLVFALEVSGKKRF